MILELWTTDTQSRFDRFMGKLLSDEGLRYENIKKITDPAKWVSRPDTIALALGRKVFNHLQQGDTLDHLRGSVWPLAEKNSYVIHTYSPCDTVLTKDRFQNLFNADLSKQVIWWRDCKKAVRIYREGYKAPEERFIINPSYQDILDYCRARVEDQALLAIDLETIGWKDSCQPFLFGIAHSDSDGICIPLLGRHRTEIWTPGELQGIRVAIEDLLMKCPQVYQNALFDVKVLQQNNYKINLSMVKHDTMLLHHTLDSALPHTLDFITSIYGTTPYWKDTLKQAPEKLSELPLEESSTYNLRDCVVLHQVLPAMLDELKAEGLERVYYEEAMAGVPSALEQMSTGVYLSQTAVDLWRTSVNTDLKKLSTELRKLWPIGEEFNLSSSDHLAWLVANQPLKKFELLEGLKDYEISPKQSCRCSSCNRKFWAEKGTFPDICSKCGSTSFFHLDEHKITAKKKKLNNKGVVSKAYQQLLDLQKIAEIPRFYNGRFKIKISAKTGKHILGEEERQKLRFDATHWLAYETGKKKQTPTVKENVKNLKTMVQWLEVYDQWAHKEKQRSTYTAFPTWADGKVHYNILLHGTETGRPAARDVNILNQPTKNEPLFGACYVAPRGWKIVSMD